ncbi:MAG: UDP-N-acetylglucosamine--N-acetylmuramyl-(pentapeptide) pyrophosphoryl-undecaprenol N-acetylglucosamine transferase [Planctomycetota bacterium]
MDEPNRRQPPSVHPRYSASISDNSSTSRTVLLVGGGSGGHIYPNLAVVERLTPELPPEITPHLVVSQRPLDAKIAEDSGLGFTAIPAAPLSVRPRAGLKFLKAYRQGQAATAGLIRETNAAAMIATGGFVSGPAVSAARKAGLPVALVSLDAVPGRANRFAAKKATSVFSAFETHAGAKPLPGAEVIGFPLRRSAVAPESVKPQAAREYFGLDPARKTLLVFAGSQGARTINRSMVEVLSNTNSVSAMDGWQVMHVSGPAEQEDVEVGYFRMAIEAGNRNLGEPVPAKIDINANTLIHVLSFCDRMDLAWRAADFAVTRCGAGTVAEAWGNAVPSVMLPYPFHKDEHQKHNAAPLVELGGAVVVKDRIEPEANAESLRKIFASVLVDDAKRDAMSRSLRDNPPRDGAQRLAAWVASTICA